MLQLDHEEGMRILHIYLDVTYEIVKSQLSSVWTYKAFIFFNGGRWAVGGGGPYPKVINPPLKSFLSL